MQLPVNHKTILIIDDNNELRVIVSEALSLAGFNVIEASDGLIGIEMAKKHKPDLILCDIVMPEMDGYEVKRQLCKDIGTMLIPFVFLTAVAEQHEVRKGMETGADDYLVKPIRLEELLLTIETRLKKYENINLTINDRIDIFRNRIVSVLPHELLTPLNGILGFSSIIKDDTGTLSRKEIRDFAIAIEESGNRLHHLINNYLKYTTLKINKEAVFVKSSVKTNDIITNISKRSGLTYNRLNDIEFELENIALMIDKNDFEYIINEIVDNAFKFSSPGTSVKIESKTDGDIFNIIITDNGIGFPIGHLHEIGAFNQFNRGKLEQQGFGLGLVNSMLVVQKYNGSLKINKLRVGTEVNIKLPV